MKYSRFTIVVLASLGLLGCSDTEFQSGQNGATGKKEISVDQSSASEKDQYGEDAKAISENLGDQTTGADTIAAVGRSLDLYLVMDKSGSLEDNDRDCLRFEALSSFKKELRTFLGENGDVRASIIQFSERGSFLATIDNFLSISPESFAADFRRDICESDGHTNPSDAFDITLSTFSSLKENPKDMASVLFFTDGLPNRRTDVLPQKVNEMKAAFGEKIFSILLWPKEGVNMERTFGQRGSIIVIQGNQGGNNQILPINQEQGPKFDQDGIPSFIRDLSVKDSRIKKVNEANGIGKALTDFLR